MSRGTKKQRSRKRQGMEESEALASCTSAEELQHLEELVANSPPGSRFRRAYHEGEPMWVVATEAMGGPVLDTAADFVDLSASTDDEPGPSRVPLTPAKVDVKGKGVAVDQPAAGSDTPGSASRSVPSRSAFTPLKSLLANVTVAEDEEAATNDAEDEEGEIHEAKSSTEAAGILDANKHLRRLVVDTHMTPVKADVSPEQDALADTSGLLLPSHVLVATPDMHVDRTDTDGEDADGMQGIHLVDDNKARGVTRYFAAEDDDEAAFLKAADLSKVCHKCKQPGHGQYNCPHIICLMCGVWDDHERNQCPFMKLCYNCGENGHFSRDCTNPRKFNGKCMLCGAGSHPSTACARLWRVYTYYRSDERERVMGAKVGVGGWDKEAVGTTPDLWWCYNCASDEHLGDDCPKKRGSLAKPVTDTAFSASTATRGPYMRSQRGRPQPPKGTHKHFDDYDDLELPHLPELAPHDRPGGVSRKKKYPPGPSKRGSGTPSERDNLNRSRPPYDRRRGRSPDEDWFHGRGRGGRSRSPNGPQSERRRSPPRRGGREWDSASRVEINIRGRFGGGPSDSPSVGRGVGGGGGGGDLRRRIAGRDYERDRVGREEREREREERAWRNSGAGGGNVAGWGREMDRAERIERRERDLGERLGGRMRDDRAVAGPSKQRGQRYVGGY